MHEIKQNRIVWMLLCNLANGLEMFALCLALEHRFPNFELILPTILLSGAEAGLLLFMSNIHTSFTKLKKQISDESVVFLARTEFFLLNDLHLWHSMMMGISFVCLGVPWWIAVSAAKLVCLWLFVRPRTK